MKNKTIIEFNCMCCGKKFKDLSPIHEKRCVCLDCYKFMKQETFMKEKDQVTIKRLKQLAKKEVIYTEFDNIETILENKIGSL